MFRLSSLSAVPDRVIERSIRRLLILVAIAAVAFTAIYMADRWRPTAPTIVDRRTAALEEAVRADPADIAARGQLADTYFAAGRYPDAIAQYDAILETGTADTLAHLSRGRAYLAAGELDAAAADYEAVVAALAGTEMANVDPNLEAAYYALGSIALTQDRAEDAVGHLERALAIKRADADALHLLGRAYVAVGRSDDAIAALRRAIDFVPIGWAEPYDALAAAYADAGDVALAEWAAAMAIMQAGDLPAADARLSALLDGPAAVEARIGLALIAETRGDTAAAAARYEEALALDPDSTAARLGLARVGAGPGEGPAEPLPNLPAPGAGDDR